MCMAAAECCWTAVTQPDGATRLIVPKAMCLRQSTGRKFRIGHLHQHSSATCLTSQWQADTRNQHQHHQFIPTVCDCAKCLPPTTDTVCHTQHKVQTTSALSNKLSPPVSSSQHNGRLCPIPSRTTAVRAMVCSTHQKQLHQATWACCGRHW